MLTRVEIQRLRSLREKKQREALGLFVIEGEKVVAELLAAAFPFLEIYATPEWRAETRSAAGAAHAPQLITISAAEMMRISHFRTPSSVLAVGRLTREAFPAAGLARGLTLALDRVQDAGNVGTILRVADWFGIDRVLLTPESADLFNQKVINASMGSFARVPAHVVELAGLLAEAPQGVTVLGCDLEGEDVHALPPLRNAVVVIGSEGRGITPAVAAKITRRVTIPRHGGAESLNAAAAAAIVCDNLRRTQG